MTNLYNSGDGNPDGTFLTLANSANGGTAFSHVIAGGATDAGSGNASAIYSIDVATAAHPKAIRLGVNGTNPGYFRFDDTQSGTRFVQERGFYVPATVSSNYVIQDIRSSGGIMASLVIGTDRKIYITNPTTTVVTASASAVMTASTQIITKLAVTPAAAGAGVVEMAIYAADNTTLLYSYTLNSATTTTTTPTQYRYGDSSAKTSFTYDYVDGTAAGPLASGWITPVATALSTPVLSAGTKVNPTTSSSSDGSQVVTWAAVPNAHHYEAYKAPGDVFSGYTLVNASVTSPYTFTGLGTGTYTLTILAKATA